MCYSHILFDSAIKAGRGLLQAGLAVCVFRLVGWFQGRAVNWTTRIINIVSFNYLQAYSSSALITSRPTPPLSY